MRSLKPALAIATFAATLAACTTTDNAYYQPSYGYSQGYSYPSSGYYPRSNYYSSPGYGYSSPGYGYYPAPTYPPRYGYSAPYNSNPGITFTIPMGGG